MGEDLHLLRSLCPYSVTLGILVHISGESVRHAECFMQDLTHAFSIIPAVAVTAYVRDLSGTKILNQTHPLLHGIPPFSIS